MVEGGTEGKKLEGREKKCEKMKSEEEARVHFVKNKQTTDQKWDLRFQCTDILEK